MAVNPALHAEYNGRTYYFCSPDCLEMFQADPSRYISAPVISTDPPDTTPIRTTVIEEPELTDAYAGFQNVLALEFDDSSELVPAEGVLKPSVRDGVLSVEQAGTDYLPEQARWVEALGFEAAVATDWGAADTGTDPFRLPRFTPWDRQHLRFGLRLLQNLRRPGPAATRPADSAPGLASGA